MDTISKQTKAKKKTRKDNTLVSRYINFSFREHERIFREENEGFDSVESRGLLMCPYPVS